jgi:hypothetical protein
VSQEIPGIPCCARFLSNRNPNIAGAGEGGGCRGEGEGLGGAGGGGLELDLNAELDLRRQLDLGRAHFWPTRLMDRRQLVAELAEEVADRGGMQGAPELPLDSSLEERRCPLYGH